MEKLSPQKYIETQARKLPLHKCLINKDWELIQTASIIIMRQHVTKNITFGVYLVDLLCMGITDTYFSFNTPEREVDKMTKQLLGNLVEIDYNHAHNIIFAGYDFAMEFKIPPHKNFVITKNILEEDTDAIPIIEIITGGEDGKPHLSVTGKGDVKLALERLKKNAGEGNYLYTPEPEEDLIDEQPVLQSVLLDDYPIGTISAFNARSIRPEDLFDFKKINKRGTLEIINLSLEARIKQLEANPDYIILSDKEITITSEYKMMEGMTDQINSTNGFIYLDSLDSDGFIKEEISKMKSDPEDEENFSKNVTQLLEKYRTNFLALTLLYEQAATPNSNDELRKLICNELNNFTDTYPLAQLYVAFESVLYFPHNVLTDIVYSENIESCFPDYSTFGEKELLIYWLIKTQKNIKQDNMEKSIFYYKLTVELLIINLLSVQTQFELMGFLNKKLGV